MPTDGEIVKVVRENRGLSQLQLAQQVGVKELTISRLERGDPRVKRGTRVRVAGALGLQFDWTEKRILPPDNLPVDAFVDSKPKKKRNATASNNTDR